MNKIDQAIDMAAQAHHGQCRKGTNIPYIAHAFGVGMILAQVGCDEDVVAAGILHDTVEDTDLTLAEIEELFDARVAEIVGGCSEPDKGLSWEDRKRHTMTALPSASPEIQVVTCADKLHNLRSIARELEAGVDVWHRFKRGEEKQEWYYRGIAEAFKGRRGEPFESFARLVNEVFP